MSSASITLAATPTPSPSATASASATASPSPSASPTATSSPTATPTPVTHLEGAQGAGLLIAIFVLILLAGIGAVFGRRWIEGKPENQKGDADRSWVRSMLAIMA